MGNVSLLHDDKCLNLPPEQSLYCPVYHEHLKNENYLNKLGKTFEKYVYYQNYDQQNVCDESRVNIYSDLAQTLKEGGGLMNSSDPFQKFTISTGKVEEVIGKLDDNFSQSCNSKILLPIQELRSFCQNNIVNIYKLFLETHKEFIELVRVAKNPDTQNCDLLQNLSKKREIIINIHIQLHRDIIYVYEQIVNLKQIVPSMMEHQYNTNLNAIEYLQYLLYTLKDNKLVNAEIVPFKTYKENITFYNPDFRKLINYQLKKDQTEFKEINRTLTDKEKLNEIESTKIQKVKDKKYKRQTPEIVSKLRSSKPKRKGTSVDSGYPQEDLSKEVTNDMSRITKTPNSLNKEFINKAIVEKRNKSCGRKKKNNFTNRSIPSPVEGEMTSNQTEDVPKKKKKNADNGKKKKTENIGENVKQAEIVKKDKSCRKNKKKNIEKESIQSHNDDDIISDGVAYENDQIRDEKQTKPVTNGKRNKKQNLQSTDQNESSINAENVKIIKKSLGGKKVRSSSCGKRKRGHSGERSKILNYSSDEENKNLWSKLKKDKHLNKEIHLKSPKKEIYENKKIKGQTPEIVSELRSFKPKRKGTSVDSGYPQEDSREEVKTDMSAKMEKQNLKSIDDDNKHPEIVKKKTCEKNKPDIFKKKDKETQIYHINPNDIKNEADTVLNEEKKTIEDCKKKKRSFSCGKRNLESKEEGLHENLKQSEISKNKFCGAKKKDPNESLLNGNTPEDGKKKERSVSSGKHKADNKEGTDDNTKEPENTKNEFYETKKKDPNEPLINGDITENVKKKKRSFSCSKPKPENIAALDQKSNQPEIVKHKFCGKKKKDTVHDEEKNPDIVKNIKEPQKINEALSTPLLNDAP